MTVIYVYGNVKLYILNEIDILELIKIEKKLYIEILRIYKLLSSVDY